MSVLIIDGLHRNVLKNRSFVTVTWKGEPDWRPFFHPVWSLWLRNNQRSSAFTLCLRRGGTRPPG